MATTSELVQALQDVGGADCEVTVQALSAGRDLLKVAVTLADQEPDRIVRQLLHRYISGMSESNVLFRKLGEFTRISGTYYIPIASVSVVELELPSEDANTNEVTTEVDPTEDVATPKPATKRKGR